MNRERAKELLKDVNSVLNYALRLKSLIGVLPKWDELGNFLNLVDGIDEIKAKMKVLELFAGESPYINHDDLSTVTRWLTQEE